MADLRGLAEVRYFKETGDLRPLIGVMQAGMMSPIAQKAFALDLEGVTTYGFSFKAVRRRGAQFDKERFFRLYDAAAFIAEETARCGKQDAAIQMAIEKGMIRSVNEGKEALRHWREERRRKLRDFLDDQH